MFGLNGLQKVKSEEVFGGVGFRCDKWLWLENYGPNDCDIFVQGYCI